MVNLGEYNSDPLAEALDDFVQDVEGLKDDDLHAYEDLEFFSRYVMGYDNPDFKSNSTFIKQIYEHLQYTDERNNLFLGPRNSAKSTAVTINYVAWKIGHNPLIRFLLCFAAKETQGYPFSRQLAQIIESNQRYVKIFGELRPKSHTTKWSDEERTVERREPPGGMKDATISICGFGSNIPSKRAEEIIVDDIVTAENAYSPRQQDQIEAFVFQTLRPILVPGGRMIIVGSRWDMRDFYARTADKWGLEIPQPDDDISLTELIQTRAV